VFLKHINQAGLCSKYGHTISCLLPVEGSPGFDESNREVLAKLPAVEAGTESRFSMYEVDTFKM